MIYEVLVGFVLAVSHLSDGEYLLAVAMAGAGIAAVAVTRALNAAAGPIREANVERDEAA